MCKIINVQKIGNKTIIDCSPYDGDFANAMLLQIVDAKKRSFTTKDFRVEKTRACFSEGGTPWIMLEGNIPDNFLDRGNEILFQ